MLERAGVTLVGEHVKHIAVGRVASAEISAVGFQREDIDINILSPSKVPVLYRLLEDNGLFKIEFNPQEVGSYIMDVYITGVKIQDSPIFFKAYDSGLIQVSDVGSGIVGQPCQFRVDASQAGEGQLEISINDGEVPNHVQVLGGGRCLVHFTPELPKPHTIDIRFNGEAVPDCPFVCRVSDTSQVTVSLAHLELMPVGEGAMFHIQVDTTDNAELAVSVQGPKTDLPVKVAGNVKNGFTAEFLPEEVGAYTICVEYNGIPVGGTPFVGKAFDAANVLVSPIPWGTIGKSLQFTVDASKAGEGNLEITISARGRNIPTQVHPQGSARFAVSFVPLEAIDHIINITFNKESVPGAPFTAKIHTDPNHIVVSGQCLAATAVGKPSFFTLSNVSGGIEDIEVAIDSPSGEEVPAQVQDLGSGTFKAEFCPKIAGEHQIYISFREEQVPGSPFACKVYNVTAIKVRECVKGIVGKPVTFLVETSHAGPGNLEVTVNNGQVPTSAQAQGNHTYAISFNPKEAKPHIVELKFNGESVPGSPFKCMVVDAAKVNLSGEGLEKVPVGRQTSFMIAGQGDMGDPEVKILSPLREIVTSSIRCVGEGQYEVDYAPEVVGDHQVEVKMAGLHVQGSPFIVKAYDASCVVVTDIQPGTIGKPVYFSIDASQAGAGNLEIIVSVAGKNVPNYVQSEGNAKFKVNFKPQEIAPHLLSVKFNNEPVPNSPFECRIIDSQQLAVSGAGVKMCPVGHPAAIVITSSAGNCEDCVIKVHSPGGEVLPLSVRGAGLPLSVTTSTKNKMEAEYVPVEVGAHHVHVVLDGQPVLGSPFTCNVYDVGRVVVTGIDGTHTVGTAVTFTVDASQAGEGTLELVVTTGKSSVRAEVAARSRGLYEVTFVPQEPIPHFVNITFNEEGIPHNPFQCMISPIQQAATAVARSPRREDTRATIARGDGLKQAVLNSKAVFDIDTMGADDPPVVVISDPYSASVAPILTESRPGLYRVEYRPTKLGTHSVAITVGGRSIPSSPFKCEVFDPQSVRVTDVGPVEIGTECSLTVDVADAGHGALSVAVRTSGQEVKHSIRDMSRGQYQVLYYPLLATSHKVDIKYNGLTVAESPIELHAKNPATGKEPTATGLGLYQARVEKQTSFIIETLGVTAQAFDIFVTGPGNVVPPNEAIPVRCYQQKDKNLLAEFKPLSAGPHKIEVLHNREQVSGSPYVCQVYDPTKVLILGAEDRTATVGEPVQFRLDRRNAGYAELNVVAISPLGQDLPIEVAGVPGGEGDLIEFSPSVAGRYKLSLTYGGEEVPGSPLVYTVQEDRTPTVFGKGLTLGQVRDVALFKIDGRGLEGEPRVEVQGRTRTVLQEDKEETGLYIVKYIPEEVGHTAIHVFWNNTEIPGSPFQARICDSTAVRPIGGWEGVLDQETGRIEMTVGEERLITWDVSKAGPGSMDIEIQGPVYDHRLDNAGPGKIKFVFIPRKEGTFTLATKWNGALVRTVQAVVRPSQPQQRSSGRVVLTGKGLMSATCGEESVFVIDGSEGGDGEPVVSLSGIDSTIPVSCRAVSHNIWEASYIPARPGTYLLNVTWAGRLVKECPLKVSVEPPSNASKVICSGEGLRAGTMGKEIKCIIDTRSAGQDELTIKCEGPQGKKALSELNDHRDGRFTLYIRPQEVGRHSLSIQYGGHHVPGSPFQLRVSSAPDPSKVRVYGPGVEHGVLARYQSRFICDTRGAGAGQLTVRIRGPKGAFRVEMQRESQKDRTILCKYEPTEPGDYRIEVRWSGEHVPGSPFVTMIFDTEEELARFLQGGYSPAGPQANQSEFYGSIGPYSSHYGNITFPTGTMSWRGSQANM
eukprot:GFUD01045442.1.p1 GENE.GFUD01045442.1~~GFUD01045442.1.p1  ORF type:complete len:1832 (+),score=552.65 GFUD01045442.1:1088-6583(+)